MYGTTFRILIQNVIIVIDVDGLPPISISVGIVNGKDVTDTDTLFEKTDEAMYESKKKGKHTYTFYQE